MAPLFWGKYILRQSAEMRMQEFLWEKSVSDRANRWTGELVNDDADLLRSLCEKIRLKYTECGDGFVQVMLIKLIEV